MIGREIFNQPGHDAQMRQPKLRVVVEGLAYSLAVVTENLASLEAQKGEEVNDELAGVGRDYGE